MPPKKAKRGGGRPPSKKRAAPLTPSPPSPPASVFTSSESLPSPSLQVPEASRSPLSSQQSAASSVASTTSSSSSRSTSQYMDPSLLSPALATDELVKRLKSVSATFQTMKQQEKPSDYIDLFPLCHHLTSDNFFNHPSREVRLFVACSLADILRIYAPESPFKDGDQLKSIFKFLISQLEGLKNPQDISFKRYYYLLENLSLVKAFTICFDMDEEVAQGIFVALFNLIFSIISADHSPKLRSVTLALLEPIISEEDHLSFDLLDVILKHILEPVKTSRKTAYQLAKDLIIKCSESLEMHINSLLNHILIHNKSEYEGISVSNRVYDLIHELHLICPSVLFNVLPQLEYRLKSLDVTDRLNCVTLLAKMFSSADNATSLDFSKYVPLWSAFIGRFMDISPKIRLTCVKHSSSLLLNHPATRKDIRQCLSSRQLDVDENVRLEVVKAIVTTASGAPSSSDLSPQSKLEGWKYVSGNEELLNVLKDRCRDRKASIRLAALQGLGQIYKQFLEEGDLGGKGDSPPVWIHNRILEGYYMDSIEDQILIEKLFNTCLVPYKLPVKERMMQLLYIFSTSEPSVQRVFVTLQRNMLSARRHLLELLKVIQMPVLRKEDTLKLMNTRISTLSKFHPTPIQAAEHISNLVNELKLKPSLSQALQLVCDSTSDCQSVRENVNKALKSLGVSKSTYYLTIKTLLERCSSVLIDNELILCLLQFTRSLLDSTSSATPSSEDLILLKNFPFPPNSPILLQKSCLLISTLTFLFPLHVASPKVPPPPSTLPTLKTLISLILHPSLKEPSSSTLLSSLAHLGTSCQCPLTATSSLKSLLPNLISHCLHLIDNGSPREAKMSIRLLSSHHPPTEHAHLFSTILNDILIPSLETCSVIPNATSICALGHLSQLSSSSLSPSHITSLKNLITTKLLRRDGLLLSPPRKLEDSGKNPGKSWVDRQNLPHVTLCMLIALKAVTNWMISQNNDLEAAKNFFKMLTMFIKSGGADLEKTNENMAPFSNSEKSWLRLQAGQCFLKLVRFKGVGDQFMAGQYCALAKLMMDPVDQLRFKFHQKLHKGLTRGFPDKCVPIDFLGFFCLAAFEPDRKERQLLKNNMCNYVKVRRDWVKLMKTNISEERQRQEIPGTLPDYAVSYAVLLLTYLPEWNEDGGGQGEDQRLMERLGDVRKGMMGFLDCLIGGKEGDGWNYGFFKKLMQGVKNSVNAVDPLNEQVNRTMWAVCDLVMEMIMQKSLTAKGKGHMVEYPGEPKIPRLYFKGKAGMQNWRNESSYLPEGFLEGLGSGKRRGGGSGGKGASMLKARNVKEGKGKKRARDDEEDAGGDQSENEESVLAPPSSKQSRRESGRGGESEESNCNATAATPEVEELENEENAAPPLQSTPPSEENGGKRSFPVGTRRSGRGKATPNYREDENEEEVDFIPATATPLPSSPLPLSPSASPPKKKGRGRPPKSGGEEDEAPTSSPPPARARATSKPAPKMRLRKK